MEHGNQYQIKLMYEHNLQRTACNMTYGPFGGVKGKLLVAYSLLLFNCEQVRFNLDFERKHDAAA